MFEDLLKKDRLTRKEKVLLFILADLNNLVDQGILAEKAADITPKGKKVLEKLEAEGFEPTEEEIEWAMNTILACTYVAGGNM